MSAVKSILLFRLRKNLKYHRLYPINLTNMKISTLLFDFDGVVVDTESQYSRFWDATALQNGAYVDNFSLKIKGMPLDEIFAKYFSHCSTDTFDKIRQNLLAFEKALDFSQINGVVNFLKEARKRGYSTGLVTSSSADKMKSVFATTSYGELFDTFITAQDIIRGKPDPMCYLLAAQRLGANASECAVFEDSMTGLKAGNAANMRVIGLATTFPRDMVEPLSYATIDDFSNQEEIFSLLQ